jgi:phthalate 4,5-dioxygenase
MLSREENALLTAVGPGTPMGDLMRQYWMPVLLSAELAPGEQRKRVRLVGENLVAYRARNGQPGLVSEHCPHRRASLYFGRIEAAGIRCVYHGWKFGLAGQCEEMPSEPPESTFRERVRATAYPCVERGGVIWAYLGAAAPPPDLPDLEWALVPPEQRFVSKRWQYCSYFQAMEGGIDSSHISFLHSPLDPHDAATVREIDDSGFDIASALETADRAPRFEVHDTDYGVLVGARRNHPGDQYYWRITQFLLPFYTMPPTDTADGVISGHAWVPVDDANMLNWTITYHPTRPLTPEEIAALAGGKSSHVLDYAPASPEAYGDVRPRANRGNDYFMDWEAHRDRLFCGIPGFGTQDQALQESQEPIVDRTQEHLGSSDTAIIQVRKRLLNAARHLRAGGAAPSLDPAQYRVRSTSVTLPRDADWVAAAQERLLART